MTEIYDNAVDSLRIAIEYFLKSRDYSSRKHAILTLFHAIELFLKEQLHRTNPILIYKNIDAKIAEDSLTVGVKEALTRLENLGQGLPKEPQEVIEKIQKRRNRIEHHRYDHKDEDDKIISESLAFILFFVDGVLKVKLEDHIGAETLRKIQSLVYEPQARYWIAMHRLDSWLRNMWSWDEAETDMPAEFEGTVDCPVCRESYLVIDHSERPFCFYCNTTIDAKECENCGSTFLESDGECRCTRYG